MNRTPTPAQPETVRRPRMTRVMTREEIELFKDSSGRVNYDAILEWQGLEPLSSRPRTPVFAAALRPMPVEEIRSFINSSGAVDYDAILTFQQNNPDRFSPQDDHIPRPRQPETPSHEAYILSNQSKGLSERTISKYLKTTSAADEIDGDRKICAVCLDDVCGQKDKVAILDECGHEFHYCCLKQWLRRKNICPICRRTAIMF
ncbi:hypothetical protein CASFOL_017071 [Castilleja foliolosa]|uniref:RING-type E3 ubiquitin transferase n=1 Tax=Castilleja foliolosa TaxID=1961234 RepID=A0ABD3DBD4_9LAMI